MTSHPLLDNTCEQFTICMMDLEVRQDHAQEYTLPRDDVDYEPIGWVRGHEDRSSPSSQSHTLS